MITVFTPIYNRGYIIENLYQSLCRQTCQDFEWLVVNDGSTDDTEKKILSFITEKKIQIRYFRQENAGKHIAINRGVKEAEGELFFIVDSDDYLANNAVERILHHYGQVKDDETFAGVGGMRSSLDGVRIGGDVSFGILDCSFVEIRTKYGISGDLAEAYRVSVLKQFPFPEIVGEKFCPEAFVWYQIAKSYKLRFFNEKIYFCEYLPDGLTSKITQLRYRNPVGTLLTYNVMSAKYVPIKKRIRCEINFWRFYYSMNQEQLTIYRQYGRLISNCWRLVGFFFYMRDKKRLKV